jgi:hypothetical protein
MTRIMVSPPRQSQDFNCILVTLRFGSLYADVSIASHSALREAYEGALEAMGPATAATQLCVGVLFRPAKTMELDSLNEKDEDRAVVFCWWYQM